MITAGNTAPTVVVTTPVEGGTFDLGNDIPFTVTVTDPEDGPIDCAQVNVTFVLGHDTHGHAESGTTGCSGVLHTLAGDVTHGGHLFGVVSATYTDHGGTGVPALSTTGQTSIRLKQQEVEFAVNQSGTNTATDNDGGLSSGGGGNPGVHRGSLAAGDWIQLNGPFNLLNINSITFRVSDTATRTAGTPMAAIEVHQDTVAGPIVGTYNLVSTGNATTWTSQNFPISLSGTHELFLVFRAVTGGADRRQPLQPQLGEVRRPRNREPLTPAQYHFPRAKPPKATSPTRTMASPIQKLQKMIARIPRITMIPPTEIPATPLPPSRPAMEPSV